MTVAITVFAGAVTVPILAAFIQGVPYAPNVMGFPPNGK
jgi:hypothetical protein